MFDKPKESVDYWSMDHWCANINSLGVWSHALVATFLLFILIVNSSCRSEFVKHKKTRILLSLPDNLHQEIKKDPSQVNIKLEINGHRWKEVTSLDEYGSNDKVYVLDIATGEMRFGDGEHGARPPTGTDNIIVSYTAHGGIEGTITASSKKTSKGVVHLEVTKHETRTIKDSDQ